MMRGAKNILLSIHHTSNIIYLLTCEDCGTHFVGESANELHISMSTHKGGKTGCPQITEHFNCCCKGKPYSIQVTEAHFGNEHDENGTVDENTGRLRLGGRHLEEENI